MLRRLLNIASIVCLVACVALMGMWINSRFQRTGIYIDSESQTVAVVCVRGAIICSMSPDPTSHRNSWNVRSWPSKGDERWGFRYSIDPTGWYIILPYWFLVLTSGSFAMAFRLRPPWRFNLRSLFIATTLLAVLLGMIAWLDRAWIGK